MLFRDMPIRKKLGRIFLMTSGLVILVTCVSFFAYEFYSFRKSSVQNLSTIGKIIATNSTAALAFENHLDANEILSALKTEPHVTGACLYDKKGKLFAYYIKTGIADSSSFPFRPGVAAYEFAGTFLEGFQPVTQGGRQLGTLFIRSDLEDMYGRMRLYAVVVFAVIIFAFVLSYFLSRILQRSISYPILSLSKTAKRISANSDYSMRAVKSGDDEVGQLTDAVNDMLNQIEKQNASLHEFNQSLEQKVMERTHELETVNMELESFSYSVSHDLRAPLRAIIGFTAILEDDYSDRLGEDAKRITGVIRESTTKMGMLIDDLLAFSRLGRQNISKTTVNMNHLISEIIRGIDVEKIEWVISDLPNIEGDINTLRQVWVNLISNAVKYSRDNVHPVIEIGSYGQDDAIVFFIKDNGVGFDQQYAGKLFKVFQRLHSEEEFEGTGVGLAIVEKIIAKHGGEIRAEAEVNKGATFFIKLPI
jgi:signal transduction histidine kinase